jgi:GT2 family glycosyltransferase
LIFSQKFLTIIGNLRGVTSGDHMNINRKPIISVIIPCKGHAAELRTCLTGLNQMAVKVPYEIIVVNSDSDPKVRLIGQHFPNIKIVQGTQNLSAGPARNLGATRATGHFFAFIDADCIPTRLWLQSAYDVLANGARMVGGPVLDALPCHPVAVADNLLQFADLPPGRPMEKVAILPGCNLAVRKKVFEMVKGFPNELFIEDSLFTRAIAARWPEDCRFVPQMQIYHRGRKTLKELWEHQHQFGYVRGNYGFRLKHNQQGLARHWMIMPLIMAKRIGYIFNRTHKWNPGQLIRCYLFLPLTLFGQLAWAVGFRHGCRKAWETKKRKSI